jgi:hypothetical protein
MKQYQSIFILLAATKRFSPPWLTILQPMTPTSAAWKRKGFLPFAFPALPLVAASAALLASCLAIGCCLRCSPCVLPCHWLQPPLVSLVPALPLVAASAGLLGSCLAIGCSLRWSPWLLPPHWLQPPQFSCLSYLAIAWLQPTLLLSPERKKSLERNLGACLYPLGCGECIGRVVRGSCHPSPLPPPFLRGVAKNHNFCVTHQWVIYAPED